MSGWGLVQQCRAPNTVLRDIGLVVTQAANYVIDVTQGLQAIGLDIYIRNRGAAAITVSWDGQVPITIDAGDVFIRNDHKYAQLNIVAAVQFDLAIGAITINFCQREGWL